MASQVSARWRGGRAEETWSAHYAALAGWAAAVTGDADLAHRIASAAFVRLFSHGRPDDARVTLYRTSLHELERGRHVGLPHLSRWRAHAQLLALAGLTVEEAALVLHRPERALAAVFDGGDRPGAEEDPGRDLPVAEGIPRQATHRHFMRR